MAVAGDPGSPSKHVKMMTGILEVLAREVLNPASSKETRDAAHTCLQVRQLLRQLTQIEVSLSTVADRQLKNNPVLAISNTSNPMILGWTSLQPVSGHKCI